MEEKKTLEVVSGDGSNLDISPVFDHLNASVPKNLNLKPKGIVIPEEASKKSKLSKKNNKKKEAK